MSKSNVSVTPACEWINLLSNSKTPVKYQHNNIVGSYEYRTLFSNMKDKSYLLKKDIIIAIREQKEINMSFVN